MLHYNELSFWIRKQNYKKCCEILENHIKQFIVKEIKKINPDYTYTTLYNLIDDSRYLLNGDLKELAYKIRVFSYDEEYKDNLYRLMNLCEEYNIK